MSGVREEGGEGSVRGEGGGRRGERRELRFGAFSSNCWYVCQCSLSANVLVPQQRVETATLLVGRDEDSLREVDKVPPKTILT